MSGSALGDFQRREAIGSPIEAAFVPEPLGAALSQYLVAEGIGSPIEAAETGGPVNGLQMQAGAVLPGGDEQPETSAADLAEMHSRLVAFYDEAERGSINPRKYSERDRDWFDGMQIDDTTMRALNARGQPPLVDNIIRDKMELLSGMERKSRTDPKAFARTPEEDDRAEAATQALRYIADDVGMPMIRSQLFQNMLVEGYGGVEMGLEDDGEGGQSITCTHVPWEKIFFDPHSCQRDFLDARYLGLVVWMDREQLLDLFPDARDVALDSFAEHEGSYDDKPGHVSWQDNRRERCRVVQIYWTTGGQWWSATITRQGFLAQPAAVPFKDRKGRSACPLILQAAYVDRENRRYGAVRDLISLQDMINKRQSKSLHLLSVNRVIYSVGAVDDVDKLRREAAKPDGVIEVAGNVGDTLKIESGGDLAMGQMNLLQLAYQRMQTKGPNAAMSGTDSRDQSGRAILAQQAGGAAANEPLMDGLRHWQRRVYEMAWMAARENWKGQKWLRMSDDLGKVQWVGLNKPVTLRDELAAMPEEQRFATMQRMQIQPNDERLMQVLRVENDITDLTIDITIEEGPDVPAQQAEDFQALIQLAGSQPGLIPPDVLIAASQLRDKDKLLERMEKAGEANGQGQAQQMRAQQAMFQKELGLKDADIRLKDAQATLALANAGAKPHETAHKIAQTEKLVTEAPFIGVGPTGDDARPPPKEGAGPK